MQDVLFFPAGQAGWRIGTSLLFTVVGMAVGGWMAGSLYDLTGSYAAAFIHGIAWNVLNLGICLLILWRTGAPRSTAAA